MDTELERLARLIGDAETRLLKRFDELDQRIAQLEQKTDDGFAKEARALREHNLAIKALTYRQPPHQSSHR